MAGEIPVFCAFDEIVPLDELRPNPKNPNRHPGDQVELLARVIKEQGWRQPVKVSTRSGLIVSGHGRYEAALLLGCPVPVDFQDYPGEAEEMADLLADNRIAELSDTDNKMLSEIFRDLDAENCDLSFTGFTESEIKSIFDHFSEPNFDELDNDAEIEKIVSVKITFDTYKEYAKVEKDVKSFVESVGARMVVTK